MKIKPKIGRRLFWLLFINVSIFTPAFLLMWLSDEKEEGILLIILFLLYALTLPTFGLLTSRWRAKRLYNLYILKPNEYMNPNYEWYLQTVYRICKYAGMKKMPQVAVYESEEPNAFATGYSRRSSLIAVSTGLLETMDDGAVEAVIAHEVSHIMNGDMVTQTLIHSSLNLFISIILFPLTLYRWIFIFVAEYETQWVVNLYIFFESIIRILFFFFAGLISKAYSRRREYQADLLAARLTSPQKMIQALRALENETYFDPRYKMNAAQHFNGRQAIAALFSTHPTTEKRISFIMQKSYRVNDQKPMTFSWKIASFVSILALLFSYVLYSGELPASFSLGNDGKEESQAIYLLANSANEYLKKEEIEGLNTADLRLARNEIYARHGFIFGPKDLQDYFSAQSWYSPNPDYKDDLLSEVEHKNIHLIQQEEGKR